MKILQVIPYFVPAYSYGGPLKVCFDLSKELVKRGHEVTVVTTDTLDGNKRIKELEEQIEGIRIIRFKNLSNYAAKHFNAYLPVGFYFWIKKNITHFDTVHCHDFFTFQNIFISSICKKNKIPFVIQPHGTLSPVSQNARFKIIKKLFIKLFSGVLYNSKQIFALTLNEKKQIIDVNTGVSSKIKVIPNGVKTEDFENINTIDLHTKYAIPLNHKIIGYIGRMQYIKGVDISIEILAQLKNELDFTFLIIGPDEGEKSNLEKQIQQLELEKQVVFAGILSGKEKLETIKSCDLFLFTSRSEGLPMSILEVASLGIPQVISDTCNVPEIELYEAGYEIKLKEQKKFCRKLNEIAINKNLSFKMRENASKMIQAKFTLGLVVDKIENTYKE